MFCSRVGVAVAAACLLAPLSAAMADDRSPTADELARIEEVLRAEGFVAWDEEIEWEDGMWKIDEAETADGEEYQVKIDQTSTSSSAKRTDDESASLSRA